MCTGGRDQKYSVAGIEARVKGVAFVPEKTEEPGQPQQGAFALLPALGTGWMRKGLSHV